MSIPNMTTPNPISGPIPSLVIEQFAAAPSVIYHPTLSSSHTTCFSDQSFVLPILNIGDGHFILGLNCPVNAGWNLITSSVTFKFTLSNVMNSIAVYSDLVGFTNGSLFGNQSGDPYYALQDVNNGQPPGVYGLALKAGGSIPPINPATNKPFIKVVEFSRWIWVGVGPQYTSDPLVNTNGNLSNFQQRFSVTGFPNTDASDECVISNCRVTCMNMSRLHFQQGFV